MGKRDKIKEDSVEKQLKMKEYREKSERLGKIPNEIKDKIEDWDLMLEGETIKLNILKFQLVSPKPVTPYFEFEKSDEWLKIRIEELNHRIKVQEKQVNNIKIMKDKQLKVLYEQEERIKEDLPKLKARLHELGCEIEKESNPDYIG